MVLGTGPPNRECWTTNCWGGGGGGGGSGGGELGCGHGRGTCESYALLLPVGQAGSLAQECGRPPFTPGPTFLGVWGPFCRAGSAVLLGGRPLAHVVLTKGCWLAGVGDR